ncbi:hypothetical protein GIB67_009136 [Kingdonia uniflora]|uniref:Eukaryotic translation initiation factor 2A n=1 Tax=Kingdonia uniflora TaxID=39325 RepID=A0A7J7N226_9MAGN|nr:hypothetical protein GIB67_009136 [Kingdonia uniflora]
MEPSPQLEILAREREGFSLWTGPPFNNCQPSIKRERVPCTSAKFSEDGSRYMVIQSDSTICIYNCCSSSEIRSFKILNVLAAALSPRGTYLQTFQKFSTPQDKNLVLWNIETGNVVYNLFQKGMSKTTWPSIQFSSDEVVACRLATNEIQFFDGLDFSKGFVNRIRVPGIAAVELSKAPGSYVAAFVPESKGVPASVQIFACAKDAQGQVVARRSFFRCSTVQLSWNLGSTGLLAVAQSDVDKTNQSYYGESKLYYLTTDGKHEGLVPLRKEGPVHDVRWSCTGSEFGVVYGFLCLAGFGNLPGDMVVKNDYKWIKLMLKKMRKIRINSHHGDAFWDYAEKRLLGNTKSELSVTSEWSPDGRYFMTATTAPRLQVDNGIKIFLHNGSLYFKKMFDKLYQADWKPEAPERFSDISELLQSVGSLQIDERKQGQGSKSSRASTITTTNPPVQKPAAYRPPHAKNADAVQAELFGGAGPTGEMSKNALRNKKRREKKKATDDSSASNNT